MPHEGIGIVGMRGVKVLPIGTQTARKRRVYLLQAHDYHLGNLPCPKGIEMGIVGQGLVLICKGVGRIVHQRLLATLKAKSFIKGRRHLCQIYHRYILSASHRLHGLGIVAMGILESLLILIEETAGGWRAEDDGTSSLTHTVNEDLQVSAVGVPGTVARFLLLLVVMAKLHNHVVTLLELRQDLVETQLGEERGT